MFTPFIISYHLNMDEPVTVECRQSVTHLYGQANGELVIGGLSVFATDAQLERITVAIAEYFAAKPIELGPAAL